MTGQLDILNCGDGHTEIKFQQDDPIESTRASRIISDMLRRGYALFVHGTDNTLIRVKAFDPTKGVYIIADGPTVPPETEPVEVEQESIEPPRLTKAGKPDKRCAVRKVPMGKVKATVVGRSAGG